MRYLHTMVRITDIDASLKFYCDLLGLKQTKRIDRPEHKYSLVFVAAEDNPDSEIELTYNHDPEDYSGGRNFGHLAFRVENIYEKCQILMDGGVTINRPPRDGRMAFVLSPDGISIELLQDGEPLESAEPWASMENTGSW
ncbi:MAG: lactoylglutathione lyase [Rhodospirillaceae bacterium]|nr:lactoylglutathione lyase [Rhodospirillaceae bacterium]MBT5514864.1 lactoylglutathione lyase [Rhodospirillaceae bacterium]MBT6087307.1 lactoylglutathione lyase [Rhodospirillaceae bacterium]MBT6608698.1 lactoylglutathione lyase [Rhodospirillaceae bacterium]MBT6883836.1 lactoylglutathione lyase [Rhodospirillaceae bacterium]